MPASRSSSWRVITTDGCPTSSFIVSRQAVATPRGIFPRRAGRDRRFSWPINRDRSRVAVRSRRGRRDRDRQWPVGPWQCQCRCRGGYRAGCRTRRRIRRAGRAGRRRRRASAGVGSDGRLAGGTGSPVSGGSFAGARDGVPGVRRSALLSGCSPSGCRPPGMARPPLRNAMQRMGVACAPRSWPAAFIRPRPRRCLRRPMAWRLRKLGPFNSMRWARCTTRSRMRRRSWGRRGVRASGPREPDWSPTASLFHSDHRRSPADRAAVRRSAARAPSRR